MGIHICSYSISQFKESFTLPKDEDFMERKERPSKQYLHLAVRGNFKMQKFSCASAIAKQRYDWAFLLFWEEGETGQSPVHMWVQSTLADFQLTLSYIEPIKSSPLYSS